MDAVDAWLGAHPESPVVLDVLGTLDPEAIRARAFELEPEGIEVFAFSASVGALFGVRRRDGSRVAIKINALFDDPAYAADVHAVQEQVRAAGFPAPRPLRRVGTSTVDEWLDDGEFRDGHDPAVRAALATTLARLIDLATAAGGRPSRTFLQPVTGIWPKPHNVLFDFEATTAGAERIDEIGKRARGVAVVGREVVAHMDWAAKHVRFDEALSPTAVYDWDISTELEPVAVGSAAGSFVYTEELAEPVPRWPTPDESLAFIADYQRARGVAFSAAEHRTAVASTVYLIAYASRCHHAVGGSTADTHLEEFGALL